MMMYFYKRHLRFAEVYAAEIVCKTEGEKSVYGTEKLMCVRLREELHTVNKAFKFKDKSLNLKALFTICNSSLKNGYNKLYPFFINVFKFIYTKMLYFRDYLFLNMQSAATLLGIPA